MTREVKCTLGQLGGLIDRDMKRLQKRIDKGIEKTAERGVKPIQDRAPKAFGELAESVQNYSNGSSGNPVIAVDAPHAADVEIGSAPHTPDFEKLLAWVKLRGLQGLSSQGREKSKKWLARGQGPTTARQARRVAKMLKTLEVRGGRGAGRHSPVGAPEAVARAISKGIEKHGTQPHWFVRNSLGDIETILDEEMKRATDS